MKCLNNSDIEKELQRLGRTYLTGDLKNFTDLNYIKTSGLEIGISKYKEFKYDKAHLHKWNNEYNYVLEGEIKVYIFSEAKEYHFKKGDLFNIEPNMAYMTKSIAVTDILFVKSPGGNDKSLIDISDNNQFLEWTKSWEEKMI